MRINGNLLIGVGLSAIVIGLLGLLSRWLEQQGVAFRFVVEPQSGPIILGLVIMVVGWLVRRNARPLDQPVI